MAKRLNVALDFSANTTQAKAQIQELQQLLTKIAYGTNLNVDASQMREASAAAKELALHLNEAYSTTTGNYDLSKLQASLAKSKTSVTELSQSLLQAGTTGQEAFVKLAQSIAAADQPMIRLNARLTDFLTTVKNTVKWQISSSMIHGVMSTLQGAYGYAQDLNDSLNEIRIVTGYNIDYMEKFADKANKAAKALSSTTLDYTDASLVYFQQGLPEDEVIERTEATIKMANVTGDSAQTVSDQMTSIWNNFDRGGKSLEYYADVMTALGAATASSTSEIADGLQKFAAVTSTIGLSYEYAATAIATVVDKTRESADVVGTAFKTLFSRMQALKLGETLEDGTDLTKYSQALETVGVSVKDQVGELRNMDDILDDLGTKWGELHQDQKVGLAQTVAGVRQYNQLIALMDNWDAFQKNLNIAYDSEGTLEEQQKIYEESWEAANKRLKASFQALYQDLIDDKFFIKMTDFVTSLVDGADDFIDRIGGVKPLLMGVGSLVLGLLSNKIQPAIDNMINNIKILVGGPSAVTGKIYGDLDKAVNAANLTGDAKTQVEAANQVIAARQKLALVSEKMSDSEKRAAEIQIGLLEAQQHEIEELIAKKKELSKTAESVKNKNSYGIEDLSDSSYGAKKRESRLNQFDQFVKSRSNYGMLNMSVDQADKYQQSLIKLQNQVRNTYEELDYIAADKVASIKNRWIESFDEIKQEKIDFSDLFNESEGSDTGFIGLFSKFTDSINEDIKQGLNYEGLEKAKAELVGIQTKLSGVIELDSDLGKAIKDALNLDDLEAFGTKWNEIKGKILGVKIPVEELPKVLRSLDFPEKVIKEMENFKGTSEEANKKLEQLMKNSKSLEFKPKVSGVQTLTSLASAAGSVAMAFNTLKSTWETINDPDVSGWEKVSSVVMSISMMVPSVLSSINQLKTGIQGTTQIINNLKAAQQANNFIIQASTKFIKAEAAAEEINNVVVALRDEKLEELNETQKQKIITEILDNTKLDENTAKQILNIATTESLSAAVKELAISLGLVNTPLAATIGWLLIAAAAIAAIVGVIYVLIKRSQSFDNELKQSNEDLETFQNNLNNVTSEIDQVNSALDGLDSKYQTLENLTYGTTEWRDALYDVNDTVQDLIDKYGLLEGEGFYRDSVGALHLTEEGQKQIDEENLSKENKARTATNAQDNRNSQLQLEEKAKQLAEENTNVNIGINQQDITKDLAGTKTSYSLKTNEYASLNESDINKVIQAAIDNVNFGWTEKDLIDLAGLDEDTAKLITSNTDVRDALQDLTSETSRLADSYENDILNELLSRGLNLSGYDEEYRNGVGAALAHDVKEKEDQIILERSQDGNKLTKDEILDLLSNQGFSISSISSNALDDFINNNQRLTVQLADENGYETGEERIIDYDTLLANYAAEQSREWGLGQQDNYYDEQKYTQQALTVAEGLQSSWDEQGFTQPSIPTNEGERQQQLTDGTYDNIDNLRSYLSDNSESFSKMFGLSEEDFGDWINDTNNLIENFGELQEAIKGNTGAINELRDEMGSLGTHGQELVDSLSSAWDKCSDKVKNYSDYLDESTSTNKQYNAENEAAFDEFVSQNSNALSDLAGISQDTFNKLYKEDKRYAKKVAKLMPEVAKGNQKALAELNVATQRAFYTTSDNVNAVLQNIANSTSDELKSAFGDSLDDVRYQINNCFTEIQAAAEGLQLDPEFDTTSAISSLNMLIEAFGFTAEQAQTFVASMGFSASFKTEPKKHTEIENAIVYTNNLDEHGHHLDPPKVVPIETVNTVEVPTIETLDYEGKKYGGDVIDNSSGSGGDYPTGNQAGGETGGSSYTPPPPKEYDDEIERYHVIKQKIEDLQEVMDHLAKAKDRAFGTSKLQIMDQEIEKYGEMIDLQNQYIAEIEANLAKDKSLIASYGAVFDETGVITNYEQIMKAQIDKYNASIGQNEDADDAAEEAYDDFIEALEQYEETNNLLQDELETLYDLQTELADVIFEKTEYKITIRIDVKDEELEYLEYLLSKIEDDAYAAAEAIALMGAKSENALAKISAYEDGLLELLSNHGIGSIAELNSLSVDDLMNREFTEDEIDLIREWNSAILEANQELLEMRDTIQEQVLESFEQFNEDLEQQIEIFEHYESVMSTVKDIASLLGNTLGDSSRRVLHDLNRAMLDNGVNNIAGQRQVLATLREQREMVATELQRASNEGNDEMVRKWKDTLDEIDEQVRDAEENFLDTWLDTLEKAKEIYEEEMDEIVSDFEKGISPIYGTIEALRDTIGRADQIENQYLSDSDKAYELSKLRRQIEGSIDDTNLLANKKSLLKLEEDINKKLKDGTKISEYDLKIMQAKYELELARQALDETQNANSMVRLTRDSNGNYGYVYTADDDKIAEAEQNYEDKLHAYQQANEDYLDQLADDILQVQETFEQAIQDMDLAYANGEITQSEHEARIAEINKWYAERMNFLEQEYEKMFENSANAAQTFKDYYKDVTSQMVTEFDQTSLSIATGYNSLNDLISSFWKTHNDYLAKANDLMGNYKLKLDNINETAGTVSGAFADNASGWAITITGESKEVLGDLESISNKATESFKEVIKAASDWESQYGEMIDNAIAKSEDLVREMQKMIAALAGLESTDFGKYEDMIDTRKSTTANNIVSTMRQTTGTSVYTASAQDAAAETGLPAIITGVLSQLGSADNSITSTGSYLSGLDLDKIMQAIGLNVSSLVSQLTGLRADVIAQPIEHIFNQNVQIDADFPNVTDSNEIIDALQTIVEEASQFANQKTV